MSDIADVDFAKRAAAEIDALHRVLQAWLRGEEDADVGRVLSRFHRNYRMVGAAGSVVTYEQMATVFPKLRGTRPSLIMEIREVDVRHVEGTSAVVSYLEIQKEEERATQRWSVALLVDTPERSAPLWKHLQETFIP